MSDPYQPPESNVEIDASDLASRWVRFFGALIDQLVIGGITIALIYWATGAWESALSGAIGFGDLLFMAVLSLIAYVVIHGYTLATRGQTIGKLIVKAQIVSVEDSQILPLPKLVALRYLPIVVAGLVPLVGPLLAIVDVLFIFRSDKRCVHDLIASTKVINYTG